MAELTATEKLRLEPELKDAMRKQAEYERLPVATIWRRAAWAYLDAAHGGRRQP